MFSYFICTKLAEALYEYGKGNLAQALELLGPDFNANCWKVVSSSPVFLVSIFWLYET